ncbi:MAG: prolyl oligopeptidase family serine peptidase [Prevotellaceae bacterium]|jgi:predicted peptidase|nr:prolyl oligopeptidase family serine peptidase [Prevotellaceae bacterium]
MIIRILSILFAILYAATSWAQTATGYFKKEKFTHEAFTLPYRVMYPEGYDSTKQYPLVVFLHGAGERGDDNEMQLKYGHDFFIKYNYSKSQFPAIVVAPQCPLSSYWPNVLRQQKDEKLSFAFGVTDEPTPAMKTAMALVDYWLAAGRVDNRQVYIGGLSMGGMGTLEMLWRKPSVFAAAFPVCGGADMSKLNRYSKMPMGMWLFHGDADVVVPVQHSREVYNALKAVDFDVRYTEYPNVNHNSWDHVFQETMLMPWLFGHKK